MLIGNNKYDFNNKNLKICLGMHKIELEKEIKYLGD